MVDSDHRSIGPLRIVFFGTPAFAVPSLLQILASRHTVAGVVTQPDRPRGRGHRVTDAPVKIQARAHGLPILQPARLTDGEVAATLTGWGPDLGVVVAYGRLIPRNLLTVPRLGMINVHASLLPRYRGAAPVQRAVIDGAAQTGVTIMRVIEALDAGGTFAAVTRPIDANETSDVVEQDLATLGASLLLSVIEDIVGGAAVERPQDDRLSTYAPRLTKAEGLIDWTLPATDIHNRVRGLHPWPHAYTYADDQRVIVLRTSVEEPGTPEPPGTCLEAPSDQILVATGHNGRLAITRLQLESGRAMTAREFLASRPAMAGIRFTGR